MMRRYLPALVLAAAASTLAHANLLDTWQEIQGSLTAGDIASMERAVKTLEEQAAELEVRRMTAFAGALIAWAEANPGAGGQAAVRSAKRLDPQYPPIFFLEAKWSRERGSWTAAVRSYLRGWMALLKYEPSRRAVGVWLTLWIVLSLVLVLLAMMVVTILRHIRAMVFDLRQLGGRLFRPANAWVLAVVVLLLPLFAGLGPFWLVVYLFAMSWAYLSQRLRIWAFAACLVLVLVAPTLAWVQADELQQPQLTTRVGAILDERQVDFSILREFSALEGELESHASYHLILGELFRMHGEPVLAKVEFQKAILLDPDWPRPLIFVGNLEMEEGKTKRAIQLFNQALEKDENAFAYNNLSLAFDLNRQFQEGDAARAKAREIAGREAAGKGIRGLDPRIRYPRLGMEDVERLYTEMTPDQRLTAGRPRFSLTPMKQLASPISLVFAVGGFVGLVILLYRARAFPPARECTKCGKVYQLESGFGESTVYCSQCVSVFQKRDVVSIEQQTAKLKEIKTWERWGALGRRVFGLLIPGSSDMLDGRVLRGMTVGFLAAFFLTGALIWVPMFLPRIEPLAASRNLEYVLLALYGLLLLRSGMSAWNRR
jgi:tetratricopeptide (TPR) repeat protein